MNIKIWLILLLPVFLIQCRNSSKLKFTEQPLQASIKTVAKSRIFFGHQSVGQNIVDGIKELINTNSDTSLHIINIRKTADLPRYFFAHTKVGRNTHPESKCDDFANIINHQLANSNLQYAFLKFCFVDINAQTDINKVFSYYRKTIERLNKQHPEIQFIHVTVPLRTKSVGIKAKLKKWLGKTDDRELNNIKRCQYNETLKQYYHNEPIFDLAAIESTYPDGTKETFKVHGKSYYALINDYSSDGGHLNKLGRKLVAGKLIVFLSDLIKSKH